MYKGILILLACTLLMGCTTLESNVPKGFTKESHEELVSAYRSYEKGKNEFSNLEAVLGNMFEYRKKEDNGELTEEESVVSDSISQLALLQSSAYKGLNNESYSVTELVPNRITAELMTSLKIEDIEEVESRVLTYLALEPLPINEEDEAEKRLVFEESIPLLKQLLGVGPENVTAAYEDSLVVHRKEKDEYYIATPLVYNGETFKVDAVINSQMDIVDAYIPNSDGGPLSTPMNDDVRPEWLASLNANAIDENDPATDTPVESAEEEDENSLMDDIYGTDKEIQIDENGNVADSALSNDSTSAPSEEGSLTDWDKEAFLGRTVNDLSENLDTLRQIHADALSLDLDTDRLDEAFMTLSLSGDELYMMLIDPNTSTHFSVTEKESAQLILDNLMLVFEAEQQLLENPTTENIRIADSAVESAQMVLDGAQFDY